MTDTLREAALKATPGPWEMMDGIHSLWIDAPEKRDHIADVFRMKNGVANAQFIALANPIAILSILDERDALAQRVEKLEKALTPSAETKAAYIGEFNISFPEIDENGNDYKRSINVPWTTTKEIMAAILAYAARKHWRHDHD